MKSHNSLQPDKSVPYVFLRVDNKSCECEEPYDYKIGYMSKPIFNQKPLCSNNEGCICPSMCKYPLAMYSTARSYFNEDCCVSKYLSKI